LITPQFECRSDQFAAGFVISAADMITCFLDQVAEYEIIDLGALDVKIEGSVDRADSAGNLTVAHGFVNAAGVGAGSGRLAV
jgi:hypothetical protein